MERLLLMVSLPPTSLYQDPSLPCCQGENRLASMLHIHHVLSCHFSIPTVMASAQGDEAAVAEPVWRRWVEELALSFLLFFFFSSLYFTTV